MRNCLVWKLLDIIMTQNYKIITKFNIKTSFAARYRYVFLVLDIINIDTYIGCRRRGGVNYMRFNYICNYFNSFSQLQLL